MKQAFRGPQVCAISAVISDKKPTDCEWEAACNRVDTFWEKFAGQPDWDANADMPEFLAGFAEGEMEVWNKVKSRLKS